MNKWIDILKSDDFIGVKKYIKEGGDVNEANDHGESVLAYALRYGCDFDLLMLLVENGADIFDFDEEGVSILDMAITYGNLKMVEYLLGKGYDVNATRRKSGFTPLMAAACYGRVEVAKLLLAQGADKNRMDIKGFRAVDFARKMNKKSILDLLGVDESVVFKRERT